MGPLDAIWHLLNLFVPALGLGLLASAMAKWLWRRELASQRWWALARTACAACAAVTVAGLVLLGRDGKMLTYAAMVVATAAALWWQGWGARRR